MPLSDAEIKRLRLVRDPVPASLKACSYDLRIGGVYAPYNEAFWNDAGPGAMPDDLLLPEFELAPRGIAWVISQETVALPPGLCAYAMPKTSLCQKGIFILNTGIVDPGWFGPISGVMLNFSRRPFRLAREVQFLRLVFEPVGGLPLPDDVAVNDRPQFAAEYKIRRIEDAMRLPPDFLNMKAAAKEAIKEDRDYLTKIVWIVALVVSVSALVVTITLNILRWYAAD